MPLQLSSRGLPGRERACVACLHNSNYNEHLVSEVNLHANLKLPYQKARVVRLKLGKPGSTGLMDLVQDNPAGRGPVAPADKLGSGLSTASTLYKIILD